MPGPSRVRSSCSALFKTPGTFAIASTTAQHLALFLLARSEHDGGLGRQQPERESFEKIQFDDCTGMARITDGKVLTDIQFKITAAGREHEPAFDSGGPNDPSIH